MDSFLQGRPCIKNTTVDELIENKQEPYLVHREHQNDTTEKILKVKQEVLVPEGSEENVKVETTYEGNLLRKITIHCECGKAIILDCCYDSNVRDIECGDQDLGSDSVD